MHKVVIVAHLRLFPARARASQPARAAREPAGHVRLVRRPFDWQVQLPELRGDA